MQCIIEQLDKFIGIKFVCSMPKASLNTKKRTKLKIMPTHNDLTLSFGIFKIYCLTFNEMKEYQGATCMSSLDRDRVAGYC